VARKKERPLLLAEGEKKDLQELRIKRGRRIQTMGNKNYSDKEKLRLREGRKEKRCGEREEHVEKGTRKSALTRRGKKNFVLKGKRGLPAM